MSFHHNELIPFNNEFLNNYENFNTLPIPDTSISDKNYQCSNNALMTGRAMGAPIQNTTLEKCKRSCSLSGSKCVGFDFDKDNNTCILTRSVSNIDNTTNNNQICVKKNVPGCDSGTEVAPALKKIFNNSNKKMVHSTSSTIAPAWGTMAQNTVVEAGTMAHATSSSNAPAWGSGTMAQNTVGEMGTMAHTTSSSNAPAMGSGVINQNTMNLMGTMAHNTVQNTTSTIPVNATVYVDMPCFLDKIDLLKNNDNLMVDLQLITSNLKSCSYIKKNGIEQFSTDQNNICRLRSFDTILIILIAFYIFVLLRVK